MVNKNTSTLDMATSTVDIETIKLIAEFMRPAVV